MRIPLILAVGLLTLSLAPLAGAQTAVADQVGLFGPNPELIEQWVARGAKGEWSTLEREAQDAAFRAQEGRRMAAVEPWLLLARWARLLGETEAAATQRWILAIKTAGLAHRNLPARFPLEQVPLAHRLRPETQRQLLGDENFSRALFDQLEPTDALPHVLAILDELFAAFPREMAAYPQLALAIALVYDVPPPPDWPHRQVSAELLPRRLPTPVEAFTYWSTLDRRQQGLHRLARLSARELKFVVNAAAPAEQRQWALREARYGLADLGAAYDAVHYREDRAEAQTTHWPGADYHLASIRREGGICVDQAYFATEVGKAWGVPTLLFYGAGKDGRHAWFGYLDGSQRWRMDVGRYAEQRYVVGTTIDPQTWGEISDHELAFLAERFRELPSYQQSRREVWLAEELLRLGAVEAAIAAARRAVKFERRHAAAWDVLLDALAEGSTDLLQIESTQRDAARAFQRFPDLHVQYLRAVVGTLRQRGQISAAENEERLIAQRFAHQRIDLAVAQAGDMLLRSLLQDQPGQQLRTFERTLQRFGGPAGLMAFDRLVRPFARHLVELGRPADARRSVELARRVLAIEPGTQFDREITALERELAAAR